MSQVVRQRLSGILARRSPTHGGSSSSPLSSSSTVRHFSSSASAYENLQTLQCQASGGKLLWYMQDDGNSKGW